MVNVTQSPDFTDGSYVRLLELASTKYTFNGSNLEGSDPCVCWRHDVDYSPHRALAMARMESERELKCVYHVLVSGRYYNIFEPTITKIFREISSLGHEIGLHFDMDVFPPGHVADDDLTARILLEKNVVEHMIGIKLHSFSFHNHVLHAQDLSGDAQICDMLNLASPSFYNGIKYISDSNGIWRSESLFSVLSQPAFPKMQVLTHPIWWTSEDMSPYQKFLRTVNGHRNANEGFYREILQRDGRFENIRDIIGFE